MATIKDIARSLGISVSSVSMALNDSKEIGEKTKRRVREKANELNYVKNGSAIDLQRKKTNTVLFITDDPTSSYFVDALSVLEKAIEKFSLDLVIVTSNEHKSESSVRFLSEQRADAVVCWSQFIDDEVLSSCASERMPIFVLGRRLEKLTNPYIFNVPINRNRAGEEMTEFLIAEGFKNIIFVHNENNSIGSIYRMDGFNRVIKAHQEVSGRIINVNGAGYDDGYRVTEEKLIPIIEKSMADAIFYSNDNQAIGGLHCLLEQGFSVPQDISIVGYSNYPISKMVYPKITTVNLHEKEMMKKTADGLIHLLFENKSVEAIKTELSNHSMNSEVIVRNSTLMKENLNE
ncbi:LacI family DNA-binding transcriptional regulator [Enterococcus faecium]|uniref:LacI family DNA-binding transcriptional regulator n=1 Tax=Enterococcus faecium TaxID=1352 RepID=UPI001105F5B9|nr:LacI family DNA-binding transcriptional regulator [Enterococcus faecium]